MALFLTEHRSPWVVFTRQDDPWLKTETAKLRRLGGRLFRVDGRELRDPESVFAAFARELSFPDYFGANWDALVDCLHDRHGHERPANGIAVLIDNADDLHDADFLGRFVSVLCQAAWKANLQLDADGVPDHRPPFALHFVFLLDDIPSTAFAEPAATGMDVETALQAGRLTATLTAADWPNPGKTTRVLTRRRPG